MCDVVLMFEFCTNNARPGTAVVTARLRRYMHSPQKFVFVYTAQCNTHLQTYYYLYFNVTNTSLSMYSPITDDTLG